MGASQMPLLGPADCAKCQALATARNLRNRISVDDRLVFASGLHLVLMDNAARSSHQTGTSPCKITWNTPKRRKKAKNAPLFLRFDVFQEISHGDLPVRWLRPLLMSTRWTPGAKTTGPSTDIRRLYDLVRYSLRCKNQKARNIGGRRRGLPGEGLWILLSFADKGQTRKQKAENRGASRPSGAARVLQKAENRNQNPE